MHTIPPPVPATFEIDSLGAVFKSGTAFHTTIELTFSPPNAPPHAQQLIKSRLQRALNIYGSQNDALPGNPYSEIEALFQMTAAPLCAELGVLQISVKVINVEVQGTPKPPSRGIHFGN